MKCSVGYPGAVNGDHDIVLTDYLTTLICFVPMYINMFKPFSVQIEQFEKNYLNLAKDSVLPMSAKRLDRGEDEKVTIYRVVCMRHKKDEFIQKSRSDMR